MLALASTSLITLLTNAHDTNKIVEVHNMTDDINTRKQRLLAVAKQALDRDLLDNITIEDEDGTRKCMFCLDNTILDDILSRFIKETNPDEAMNVITLQNDDSQLASMFLGHTNALHHQPVVNGMTTVDSFLRYIGQDKEINYNGHGIKARYLGRIDWHDLNDELV